MKKALNRNRVCGFLRAEGMELKNGRGEPVLLLGWGLGNWLLCEGYMWGMGEFARFDRPRRIEEPLELLTGEKYAARFWKSFRERYVAEADLALMAEMGYNSIRVPISARLFLEDAPQPRFKEEGFRLLDGLLDGCEKYGLYAFIDLHAAPGGQTGANIDDSVDDLCRLFIDDAQYEKGLALWEALAERYRDRWIVGGYDLLNEPIRPVRFEGDTDLDGYEPRLRQFYAEVIRRIRLHDQRHIIALEGIHWATDTGIFDRVWDDNMVMQFHRYGCPPDISSLQEHLEVARRLNVPLWLGETGENTMAWLSAMAPLAFRMGISLSLWPWKKMGRDNCPCVVSEPAGWDAIRDYLRGGAQPDFDFARQVFDGWLQNIRLEDCRINDGINAHILRIPGCEIQGTDFDELPGVEESWHSESYHAPGCYRRDTGMEIVQTDESGGKLFPFDGPWRTARLRLSAGEWAQYTVYDVTPSTHLEVSCSAQKPAKLEIRQGEALLGVFDLSGCADAQILSGMHLYTADVCQLRLTCLSGSALVGKLSIQPIE